MENRLEHLRRKLDQILADSGSAQIFAYASHMYGVSKFCALLAEKRDLNTELAATCGMLHDIAYMSGGSSESHAIEGAKQAEALLRETKVYRDEEIKLITTAIAHHSNKCAVHGDFDELLKDADVMDHCFYNRDLPIAEWEIERYNQLLAEFGIISMK